MTADIIKKISSPKVITFIFKMEDGRSAKTNIVPWFGNAVNWLDLEPGDSVKGLRWKLEKEGIIDGDSPVERD